MMHRLHLVIILNRFEDCCYKAAYAQVHRIAIQKIPFTFDIVVGLVYRLLKARKRL